MAEKICLVGSGNWGSVIAKIIGNNVTALPRDFHPTVNMWVYEELIGESKQKLTEIINTTHVNVKYLPGVTLPSNVVAVPDIVEAVKDATVLIFVIPHQFIGGLAKQLVGKLDSRARAISLIKGVDFDAAGDLVLISKKIEKELAINCSVLMGANVADEVAREEFCETTIGSKSDADAHLFKKLFNTPYFVVSTVHDVEGVELCGALKNIVAIAAGVCDGLGLGGNTKAAVMRLGLMEMKRFSQMCFPGVPEHTFLESCGVADLITTCYGGRNRKVAEAFAKTGKPFEELEKEMLDGQKLQGTGTSKDIHLVLKKMGKVDQFPLFYTVYKMAYEGLQAKDMIAFFEKGAALDSD